MSPALAMMNDISSSEPSREWLVEAALSLVNRANDSIDSYYGLSTTSCQIYDTAWLAMIPKTTNSVTKWLFPESFYYLLKTQMDDGGWGIHPATQTAGILDTAAALLALIKHSKQPLQIMDISSAEVSKRTEIGLNSLRRQLATWNDISETNHIGVELIVPSLLTYLRQEDEALSFEFPCKATLDSMNATKMLNLRLEALYDKKPSSAVHSLEAFTGRVDFDRISHHLYKGSMMASPSSTAAYLINASNWDDKAEAYLKHIVTVGAGHGDGGVCGTYPTTHFECSWILATLLQSGFSKTEIECKGTHGLADTLRNAFEDEHGIIGFAPHTADVDDTAKGLLALSLLDEPLSPERMIKVFESQDHFTTFGSERDPSFTSNCHVLLALLHQPTISHYSAQIVKTAVFLCDWWWNSDYRVKDKWHLSHLYPTMLLVQAFSALLHYLDDDELPGIDQQWKGRICVSLFQACFRTMLDQQENGSWNGHPEQTCFAILALVEARKLCLFNGIQGELQSAIARGIGFLKSCNFRSTDFNWTSKTAYNVSFVEEAYRLAAFRASQTQHELGCIGHSSCSSSPSSDLDRYASLVSRTTLFSTIPGWELQASLLESMLFVPLLLEDRLSIYARDDMPVSEDKYLRMIPFTWVGLNNRERTFASTSLVYDMMKLSLFGYQTDEFMEAVAAPAIPQVSILHKLVDRTIQDVWKDAYSCNLGSNAIYESLNSDNQASTNHAPVPPGVSASLNRFVSYVLKHEGVAKSSFQDRQTLLRELQGFLHAHAQQVEDNMLFAKQLEPTDIFTPASTSFFQWVRTTGANHVACAYSFTFMCCLISSSLKKGEEVFHTATERYLGAAMARHLTTMCRMYNDYGSIVRDNAERNVNSLHFPEFTQVGKLADGHFQARKRALRKLAEYEHKCCQQALQTLELESCHNQGSDLSMDVKGRTMEIIKYFYHVTDMYDQLYVIQDLSSSMK